MELSPSAHVDTFCRDNLPPQELWPEFLFDLPDVQYPAQLNCAVELLDAVIDQLGADRPCLLTPSGEVWTYGDLLRTANQVANHLVTECGIVPGNRIMLRGPNNPWLVACWFGVIKAGAVVIPTMPMLRPRELSTMAEIAQFDLALCDHRYVEDLLITGTPTSTQGACAVVGQVQAHVVPIDAIQALIKMDRRPGAFRGINQGDVQSPPTD